MTTKAAVNYGYGEMAADNAQARTKALYSELFSPEAKVKQLKEAGLSVGMMYGQGGVGGTSRHRATLFAMTH